MPRPTVQADIMTYLKAELPALEDHEGLAKIADKPDGLFIYAATAVRYIKPHSNMAKHEQLRMVDKLLNDISPTARSLGTWSLVDELYKQIL